MWFPNMMPQPDSYAAGVSWQLVPFYSLYHGLGASNPFSNTLAKKFMLYRSLFDLVNSSYCIELQDKKLQKWYYSRSNEERKIIQEEGGFHQFLLTHPALDVAKHIGIVHVKPQIRRAALEMSTNLNKSRMPTFYGMPQCKVCGASCPSGSETCRTCVAPPAVVEERICLTGQRGEPATRKGHVNMHNMPINSGVGVWGGNSHGARGGQVTQDSFQSAFDDSCTSLASPGPKRSPCSQSQRFSKEWRERRTKVPNQSTFKDSTAQASFSLDLELERHSKMAKVSSPPTYQVHQSQIRATGKDESFLDLAQETPPEYYSFNTTMFDQPSADLKENFSQLSEEASVDSLMATRGSTEPIESSLSTGPSSTGPYPFEVSTSCPSGTSEWTNLDTTTDESLRNQPRDEFHSIMEESVTSEPWLNCSVTPEKPSDSPSHKPHMDLPVKLAVEKGQQTSWKDEQSVAESFMSVSPDTSAVQLPASPAHAMVNQMVDASGDFRASFTCTQECAAAPSTMDASTEMDLPLSFDQDTQTLQASTAEKSVITEIYVADLDYLTQEFMRLKSVEEELEKLKAGQLQPSMKCGCECGEKLKQSELRLLALQYSMCQDHCWRRYYTSAQGETQLQRPGGVAESLAETLQALEQDYSQLRRQVLSGATLDELTPLSVDTQRLNTEARYTPAQVAVSKTAEAHSKPGGITSSKVSSLKTQKFVSSRPGGSEEGGSVPSEAWYDAEEDLAASGDGRKMNSSCVVCVTDLHQNVTEEDLSALFEKYQPREMGLTVSNTSRSANVALCSPENAEAATQELNGTPIHGQPIQVRRVGRPPASAGPEGDNTFKKPQAPSASNATPSGNTPKPGSVKKSAPYNMSPKPSRGRLEKLVNVSDVPTATGTYVPQQPPANSTTMGSFDTLMGRLSERHPQVARQKIVEALLELRAQHRGSLSGLPLRTIVEMTSELLTIQATVAQ